jgi:putative endonuclease
MRLKSSSYERGLGAEIYAALYFFFKGYRILAWRYKTPVGEVDLIVSRGDWIVFVEVKQRQSLEEALFAVTPQMRRRIGAAARHFLAGQREKIPSSLRFDVIAVSGLRIRHLDNAWEAPT